MVDLSYLERLFKGDRSRIATWVGIYLEEFPAHLDRLEECLRRNDAPGLAAVAHELRPQAHYLGAQRLLDILRAIGELARTTGAASCATAVEELRAVSASIEAELRSLASHG